MKDRMGNKFNATNVGATAIDGANVSIAALQTAAGFPSGFTSAPWTYTPGRLPGLGGTAVNMPVHLGGIITPTETTSMYTIIHSGGMFPIGASVKLTTNPNSGYKFIGWFWHEDGTEFSTEEQTHTVTIKDGANVFEARYETVDS
jgi:hypothetical protein